MTRRLVSVLVVGSVLVVAVAAVAPALVAPHGGGRPVRARVAMPSWAAGLASTMFAPLTMPRRLRHAPSVTVPPLQAGGTTCYAAGGSLCSGPACARYTAAARSAVYQPYGGALRPGRSCARPVKPLVPKVVPIRLP